MAAAGPSQTPSSSTSYTMQPPKLVVFLVGDAAEFVPKPWPREKFKEALLDTIVEFGDTWVICECREPSYTYQKTPGWLAVTSMAMEARNEYNEMKNSKPGRKPCEECKKGCKYEDGRKLCEKCKIECKWENAKQEDAKDTFCLIGIKDDRGAVVLSNHRKLPEEFEEVLNGVPKGIMLEEVLSEKMIAPLKLNKYIGKEFKMKLPTVVMVIEGDLDTINHVAKAVEKNIPVLLVRGSGMAADLIGYCLDDNEQNVLEMRAPLLFGTCFSEESFDEMKKNIETIQKHRSNVTEFNILSESVTCLKEKVTESVIRTWALTRVKGGKKAAVLSDASHKKNKPNSNKRHSNGIGVPPPAINMTDPLNRSHSKNTIMPISDRAVRPKTSIQNQTQHASHQNSSTHDEENTCVPNATNGNRKEKPSPLAIYMLYQLLQSNQALVTEEGQYGQHFLHYALQENLPDIAEVLVDKGVKMTWPNESNNTGGDEKFDGKSLYNKIWRERREHNNDRTKTCIADIIELPKKEEKLPKKKIDVWEIACNIISYKIDKEEEEKQQQKSQENIMMPSDLLLWAVLTNNVKMAELFWRRCHEPILTALVASAILRKMSRKAHAFKEEVMEEQMLNHSRLFRQRAIDVTQKFYECNEQEAIFILEHENETSVWGVKDSALEFAQVHKIHPFVAHHVPQRSFQKIWHGNDFVHHEDLYQSKESHYLCCKCCCNLMHLFTAPYVKFGFHYFFFSLFLVCLSAFVMTNIRPEKWPIDEKSVYEYCAYLWLFADIVEEYVPPVIYTIGQHTHRWKRRAWNHMHNFWNGMDFLSYLMLICGICFRFGYETTSFDISRRFYSLGLFLMYMRFLHVLLIWRRIGPTVIMLKEGLKELLRFVIIMAVFVLSVGVFYHTNLYPNHYDMFSTFGMQYWSVWKIIHLPYWSIYGEFKDEIGGEDSTGNCSFFEAEYMHDPDIVRCPKQDWMVSLMSGFFVLILNLLLVNLIIAMFSFRFEEIKENSDQFWRFHRSQVIMEFRTRVPVPFNLLWRLVKVVIFFCTRKEENKQNKDDMEARAKLDTKQQILARRWMPPESIDRK